MCFGHIHPFQLFPDNLLILYPHNLCVPPTPQTSLYYLNIPGCVFSHWSVVTLPAATLSENTASPFPCPLQLTTATHSTPPSMLGFCLVCACTGFGHGVAIPVSSYVQLPIPVRSYVQLPCLIQMLLPSCHFLCPCTLSAYTLVE